MAFEPATALGWRAQCTAALGQRLRAWIEVPDGLTSMARCREFSEQVWPVLEANPGAVLIVLGGGTTLEIAKLVRCRPVQARPQINPRSGLRTASFDRVADALRGRAPWLDLDLAPLWMVPTTAGIGSEVTRGAPVWDTDFEPPKKRSLDEAFGYADCAFVAPFLTRSCPAGVTRDTALDALSHALEAIWNRHANPISDALAVSAACKVLTALPVVPQDPANAQARSALSLASLGKGYRLTVLGHRNREPVQDLLGRGAQEAQTPAELASRSDMVFMCLPSTGHVEQAVFGESGILSVARPGLVLIDSTTSEPDSTRRIGAALREKGADMVDAPFGRTPKEAELGTLSTFVGGEPAVVQRVMPVIRTYASTIIETGALGSGHTIKLVNNFLALATSAVVGEALSTALRLGLDMRVLKEVVDSSGGNSVMFQRFMRWTLDADDSDFKAMMSIAVKDLQYYRKIAAPGGGVTHLADAAAQVYQLANHLGHERQFMPVLSTILANFVDGQNRPLPDR